ncbi:MRN complex-interacting protein [Colossoma macropomum]|uniref:MRN complex-interacting protein n=1 Tax=Colossoma macropomum TaxID=42526 RepID=UPI0018646C48|nr:MRN complex-interacting protein [Colossoma macropomum]
MGQEFHVLRCFSCQTFQVQQVKKSKKWSCKMCGEKQSLIKEYGRGTGADCRRHVQKLNSLRGELLQVENERAWTQWEKEDHEDEDSFGEEAQSCEQQDEVQVVSRWSKYVDQTGSGPGEEEEEEEENVYTERARFRSRDEISRKRKKGFTSKDASGHYTVSEDDDPGTDPAHWRAKGIPFQAHQRGGSFKSSPVDGSSSRLSPFTSTNSKTATSYICDSPATSPSFKHTGVYSGLNATGGFGIGTNKKPSAELTTRHLPSVPASTSSAPSSSHQRTSGTRLEAEGSKWTRFLTSVSAEEDKDELEDVDYAQMSSGVTVAEVAHSPSAPIPVPRPRSMGHPSREESACARAPLNDVLGPGNRSPTRVFEKLSHYKAGIASSSPSTFTSKPAGSQSPVCLQLPPAKRPCPALSFTTLFHTDEDFDDAL